MQKYCTSRHCTRLHLVISTVSVVYVFSIIFNSTTTMMDNLQNTPQVRLWILRLNYNRRIPNWKFRNSYLITLALFQISLWFFFSIISYNLITQLTNQKQNTTWWKSYTGKNGNTLLKNITILRVVLSVYYMDEMLKIFSLVLELISSADNI